MLRKREISGRRLYIRTTVFETFLNDKSFEN